MGQQPRNQKTGRKDRESIHPSLGDHSKSKEHHKKVLKICIEFEVRHREKGPYGLKINELRI